MIKYNLKCKNGHEFESWFSNSEEFDKLNKKKMLECIYCSSKKVEKSIMSPMISGVKPKDHANNLFEKQLLDEKNNLFKLRKYIEQNFEYVGDKFSKKVRDVYYDKRTKKKHLWNYYTRRTRRISRRRN